MTKKRVQGFLVIIENKLQESHYSLSFENRFLSKTDYKRLLFSNFIGSN